LIYGTIKNQRLDIRAAAAADTIDYLTADFSFLTSDWDGLVKYAHFARGDERYSVQLTDDEVREEDHLNLSSGEWTVYLHGNEYHNGDVIKRITTNVAKFTVEPTGMLDGEPFPETDPSVVEQIAADVEDHEERITAIEEAGGADNVRDVQDSEGNSLVDPDTKIATLPEYESNIVDVQDEEGNSLVNAEKIAIVPAGGKQIEIVRTVAGVDRSIYTPAELKAYVDEGRGLLYKGNVVTSYSYVEDEVDGYFTAYYFAGAANFQGQQVRNDKSIITLSGLPARPMYTAEIEKLRDIEARAEVNVINSVERADGTAVTPVNKKITLPAQVVISDTEPTDTSVLWIDTSDDTVDGIDNGEEMSFPQEVGE